MKLNTGAKRHWIKVERAGNVAEFFVEPITAEASFGLVEKATTTKYKRGIREDKTNLYQLKLSRIVKIVKDWKGIEDEEGNPIAFSEEALITVYNYNQEIIDEVLDKVDILTEEDEERLQEELKNS